MVDASERLQVLLTQEANNYRTSDYLTRMQLGSRLMDADIDAPSDDESSPPSPSKKRKSLSSLEHVAQPASVQEAAVRSEEKTCGSDATSSTQINKHWREKICEWAYQGEFRNIDRPKRAPATVSHSLPPFSSLQSSTISICAARWSALP
jgi:hypothetical protein